MSAAQASPLMMPIDVVSDVVCPWCFIGKRRLERAIARTPNIAVEVRFRPFFLNPWVPREGMSRHEYLTRKFGSPERYRGIAERVVHAAAADFHFDSLGAEAQRFFNRFSHSASKSNALLKLGRDLFCL